MLIKIASTWEGLCRRATAKGRNPLQSDAAVFAAAGGARGRSKSAAHLAVRRADLRLVQKGDKRDYTGAEDPGVQSVTEIYTYYKKFDIPTEVMGASFRNIGQIRELAGCDCLTISPELMKELSEIRRAARTQTGSGKSEKSAKIEKLGLDEKKFRWLLNENAMATKRLGEGIRKFAADVVKLEKFVASKL